MVKPWVEKPRIGMRRASTRPSRVEARGARRAGSTAFTTASTVGFATFQIGYLGLIHATIRHKVVTLLVVGCVVALSGVLFTFVGQDYFPQIDAGEMTLHIRAPSGMRHRVHQAERFAKIETIVKQTMPARGRPDPRQYRAALLQL